MTLKIRYLSGAEIQHLNIRKEGDDHSVSAVDIKLFGITDHACFPVILGCNARKAALFWDDSTEELRPAYFGVLDISCFSEFHPCTLHLDKRKFEGAKVRRFHLRPLSGHTLEVTCQVSISGVAEKDLGYIAARHRDTVAVTIDGEPGLFDDDPEIGSQITGE